MLKSVLNVYASLRAATATLRNLVPNEVVPFLHVQQHIQNPPKSTFIQWGNFCKVK